MARGFYDLFGRKKVIIGMIHLAGMGRDDKVERALEEISIYQEHGLAGIIIEDHNGGLEDIESVLKKIDGQKIKVKVGINTLRKPYLAFEWAKQYGADFIQIDSVQTPDIDVGTYNEMRRRYPEITVLGGVGFKYKTQVTEKSREHDLAEGMSRCEAIVTTGEATGRETPLQKLPAFRQIAPNFPLIVGSGLNAGNAKAQLSIADGAIVGSYFKKGKTWAMVDPYKVKELMGIAKKM